MKRRMGVLLMVLLMIPGISPAGTYKVEKGKGVEVCEMCKKSFEAFPTSRSFPNSNAMACERIFRYGEADVEVVKWTKLDAAAHVDLLIKVHNAIRGRDQFTEPSDPVRWKKVREGDLIWPKLYEAQADIDNDGAPENLGRYANGSCGVSLGWGLPIVVINGERTAVDPDKTRLILGPEWERKGAWVNEDFGAFSYKGHTYIDRFRWSTVGGLYFVYQISRDKAQLLCVLRFHLAAQSGEE